jgi:hypothetical protein
MTSFIEQNSEKFNASQLEALDRVACMKEKDILLIQGPVSEFVFNFAYLAWHW